MLPVTLCHYTPIRSRFTQASWELHSCLPAIGEDSLPVRQVFSEQLRLFVSLDLQHRGRGSFDAEKVGSNEGPPVIPPWDNLSHLHFNDRVLYFMSRPR